MLKKTIVKRKNLTLRIMLALLLILAVAVFYVYREYHRAHKDTSKLRPDYSITAADLLKTFEMDESDANKKYWDKVILVNGIVKDLSKDDRGVYSVILGDPASMSSVRCSMDSSHNNEAADIKSGINVAMKGICTGYNADELLGSDVILVRCVIQLEK